MISFTYDSINKGEKGQILATFDEQTKRFSFNRLTSSMVVDQDKTVTACVRSGRLSEFLDMLDSFEGNQDSNECLKDLLSSCEEKKAEFVLTSTLIANIEVGTISFANVPTRIYKESETLFYTLFGLILLNVKDFKSDDGHMDFYLRWSEYLKSIELDNTLVCSLLAKSLTNIPSRMKRKIVEEMDLLCMAEIWLDNLHKNDDVDTHKVKDRGLAYLLTRPRVDYVDGRFDYRNSRRRIDASMLKEFLCGTDLGRIWRIKEDPSIYLRKLDNLTSEGLIEMDGDTIFLTPIGIALTGYLIPRYLAFGK